MKTKNLIDNIIFDFRDNLEGYYVYVFWDNETPFYVGLGQKNRWKQHFWSYKRNQPNDNQYKHRKINKIISSGGKIKVTIAQSNLSKEEAQRLEIETIAKYKRKCDGGTLTNMSTGGESGASGRKHTEEFKREHSLRLRGIHSNVDTTMVRKAKLLFHYRGMKAADIHALDEFKDISIGTINSWICKSHPNYNYVAPHLKDSIGLREEKKQEVLSLWNNGNFYYKQISDILGIDRGFVSKVCRGII